MSEETIRIMCPSLVCRKVLAVPVEARGKTVKCRACGTRIRIPESSAGAKPADNKPSAEKQAPPANAA
ncbi:MAG: hypothetical protein KJZ54_12320 [Phycisphaerales bacterium]|nr:hypothetical protein [Phycisphaerales bacterium]